MPFKHDRKEELTKISCLGAKSLRSKYLQQCGVIKENENCQPSTVLPIYRKLMKMNDYLVKMGYKELGSKWEVYLKVL